MESVWGSHAVCEVTREIPCRNTGNGTYWFHIDDTNHLSLWATKYVYRAEEIQITLKLIPLLKNWAFSYSALEFMSDVSCP